MIEPEEDYREHLLESLKDPEEAAAYINALIEEDNKAYLMTALRDVVDAQEGIKGIAEKTGLNRENLYHALSKEGNPRLSTLTALLDTLGLGLKVVVKQQETMIIEDDINEAIKEVASSSYVFWKSKESTLTNPEPVSSQILSESLENENGTLTVAA